MPIAVRKQAAGDSHAESGPLSATVRTAKLPAYLVSEDESLWPQIAPGMEHAFLLKQVDTLGELKGSTDEGHAGVVIWDARGAEDPTHELSQLQIHSARFAIVVLDADENGSAWRAPLSQRQIVALVPVPFDTAVLLEAVGNAREECHARSAVLGESETNASTAGPSRPKKPGLPLLSAIGAALCAALAGGYFLMPRNSQPPVPATAVTAAAPSAQSAVPATAPVSAAPAADDQIDSLLDRARQAMLERRFIEPAASNALTLYQNALIVDPNNGEARQGLERLAQILFARVQSDLDERKFDAALQALETARSLSPGDPRLASLDARIESLRAEFGPAQILAAINAKNYDRAGQLLDEAARSKSLSAAKLAQLRDELQRRQAENDVSHILKLLAARIQQDRLIDPHNDNAVYYLQRARLAGASVEDLQDSTQALGRKLAQLGHTAIEQHRLVDADRALTELKNSGASPPAAGLLQHDLDAVRDSLAHEKQQQTQWLDQAQARIAKGELLEPENDSALYYLNQLHASNSSSGPAGQLAVSLQTGVAARARSALDAGDTTKAESMVRAAGALGASSDLDAVTAAIADARQRQGKVATIPGNSLVAVKPLNLEYPHAALTKGTEGWVDLAFSVTPEGKVEQISVLDSSPRNVFDAAAKLAISRVRYRPVLISGQPAEIKTTLHVVFRLEKP